MEQVLHDVNTDGSPIGVNRNVRCLYCNVPLVVEMKNGKPISNLERTLHQWQCKDSQECFDYLAEKEKSSLDFCVDIDDKGNVEIPSVRIRNKDAEVEMPIDEFLTKMK